ncbi:MAG: GNAT family acetyltransferase [Sedimentisphaerales bacterium]|nr:GNAT family acetyltransferase [Sedimentisphaerales bacterium]MBN2842563.1 GNAT family acetyltransferase [Sedimentisphaerales bacterium]
MLVIRPYCPQDKPGVLKLWHDCGLTHPNNDPEKDIARKMAVNPQWFLVGLMDDELVATAMIGYDGHRGWINYLGVKPELQGTGLGRTMMKQAEIILRAAGCAKINLQVRKSNAGVIAFYEKLGFSVDECLSMGKRLEDDSQ